MPTLKLTKRLIDSIKAVRARTTWWDTDISGFGLRVTPSGARTYVLKYRVSGTSDGSQLENTARRGHQRWRAAKLCGFSAMSPAVATRNRRGAR